MSSPETEVLMLSIGHYVPRCLHIASELGIADAIDEEPVSSSDLGGRLGVHADILERILTLLATENVFQRTEQGWTHTEQSKVLRSDHPRSLRAYARLHGSPALWHAAGALTESVYSGKSGMEEAVGCDVWEHFARHPEARRVFDDAMTAKSHAEIDALWDEIDLTDYGVVADIGGGRGHLLTALLSNAASTRGILFDLPEVVGGCEPHSQIQIRAGNFFKDPLPEADAYLLSNILHDWEDEPCIRILSAIRRAAPTGATLFLIENLLDQSEGPHLSKVLDVIMLTATGGRERTQAQYDSLLRASGFALKTVLPTYLPLSVLVARAV
ncbi:methyltransferase [Terriglobus albidus]|uniref:methyltransferase n=1 Tax=Terriglobus albidus TaxID=1592106 RepID=UPI0021E047D6|nr:methyltransferase [Terriglobus albidus]